MPASIGVNLRVTGHCSRGGRKYMEDFFTVAYQQSEDEKDLEYAFIGIYDGHGGCEAAKFARKHLINSIVNQKLFWSENDDDILKSIREGYIQTHFAMWKEQDKWPKTQLGLPSTAGTTASVAFIRHGKIYIGHCGDSGIALGYSEDNDETWIGMPLTQDHKPENFLEKTRIMNCGGKVISKYGVPRVVWNRPRIGHKGPVRRSTPIDEIPFLAVARSLGDLWSYNSSLNEFVVSPAPDVRVIKINPLKFRCLIFGTDGLWNVISADSAVKIVHNAEKMNSQRTQNGDPNEWTNPSKCLVDKALQRWYSTRMRADNTSVVIIMLDPPGPPKRDSLKTCQSQMIVDNDHTHQQSMNNDKNLAMHDYGTKETVELNNIPSMHLSGRYEPNNYEEAHASTSSHVEVNYANSFAESYNSLLNANIANDSYATYSTTIQNETHSTVSDDTYCLTKLQTRREQFASNSSTLYEDYQEQRSPYDVPHQYDCITSSYLLPACGIVTHLHCPIQPTFVEIGEKNVCDIRDNQIYDPLYIPRREADNIPCSTYAKSQPNQSNFEVVNQIIRSPMPSKSLVNESVTADCTMEDEPNSQLDESIQINEISSSSKENDDKQKCYSIPNATRSKTKQQMNQERRITRSNKVLKPNHNNRISKTKTRGSVRKIAKNIKIQNENLVTLVSRSLRRNTSSSNEYLNKMSLRSDDVVSSKKVAMMKNSKGKMSNVQRKNRIQHNNDILSGIPSRTLREKSKPNQQPNPKPKSVSKIIGKKMSKPLKATMASSLSKLLRSKRLNR